MRKIVIAGGISLVLFLGLGGVLLFLANSELGRPESDRDAVSEGAARESDLASGATLLETTKRGAAAVSAGETGDEAAASDAALAGAVLAGTVLDDFHDPIPDAHVALVRGAGTSSGFGRGFGGDRQSLRELILTRQGGDVEIVAASRVEVVAETDTDAEGRYAFAIASIPEGSYRILAQKDGYASDGDDWTWEPQSVEIDFRLGGGDVITGIVVDTSDAPIVLASVVALTERGFGGFGGPGGGFGRGGPRGGGGRGGSLAAEARTDSEGRFTLRVPSGSYRVQAGAEHFRPGSVSDVEAGTADVVLALQSAAVVAGKVVDTDGRPVANITVELQESNRFGRGGPGGDRGRRGDDRGRGGFGRGGGPDRGEEDREEAERRERREEAIAGLRRWVSRPEAVLTTDASGEFRFEDVPMERFALLAHGPGYVASLEDGEIPEGGPVEPITITVETAAVVSGTVKDRGGDPVVNAFVALGLDRGGFDGRGGFGDRGRGGRRRGRGEEGRGGDGRGDEAAALEARATEPLSLFGIRAGAETDADGRFVIDTAPSGEYVLSVETERHPVFRLEPLVVEEEARVDIELDEGLAIRGKVFSAASGEPIAGAELRFDSGRSSTRTVTSNENGEFEAAGFVASVIEEVRISADGHSTTYFSDVAVDGGEREFEVPPAARVSGQVVDANGKSVAKARVSLSAAVAFDPDAALAALDGSEEDGRRGGWEALRGAFRDTMRRSARTSTDVEGRFSFDEVVGGAYSVTVEHAEYERLDVERIDVAPGAAVDDLRLVLSTGARIEVAVRGTDGYAVPGASVRVEYLAVNEPQPVEQPDADGAGDEDQSRRRRDMRRALERFSRGDRRANQQRVKNTGPDGRAVFSGMLEGQYRIRVESRGFQYAYREAWAADDTTTPISVELLPEHSITGQVLALSGEPVPDARITASRETPDPLSGHASSEDEEGRGRFGFGGRGGDPRDRGGRSRETSFARSQVDGSYRLGQLAPSTYTVRVSARGYTDVRLDAVAVDRALDVVLEPLGAIAGQVVSFETGQPVVAFRIALREVREVTGAADPANADGAGGVTAAALGAGGRVPGGGGFGPGGGGFGRGGGFDPRGRGGRGRSFESPDGSFLLDDLDPGSYTLDVTAEGFTGTRIEAKVFPGETTGLSVALEEGISVRGMVVERVSSRPLPDAIVYLLPIRTAADEGEDEESGRGRRAGPQRFQLGERGERRSRPRPSQEEMARTAAALVEQARTSTQGQKVEEDGSFKLVEVPVGRYALVVDHEGFVPATREIEVASGMISDYTFALEQGESLGGTITFDREPAAGLTVVLRSADGYSRRATTDATGRYVVSGLIPGSYSVSILERSQLVHALNVDIRQGRNELDYRHEVEGAK